MLKIRPDQMSAVGSYIAREWNDYGYWVEKVESPTRHVSLFHVVAGDGSRFIVASDSWGNCRTVDSHGYTTAELRGALRALVTEMHKAAAAS